MKLPAERHGSPVVVSKRSVDFCLWPMKYGRGSWTTNSRLYVAEPWPVIAHAAREIRSKHVRATAVAFVEQAHDFFRAAASSTLPASKPLLLYYCFLNLSKALILVRNPEQPVNSARHGLSERLSQGGREILDASLTARPTGATPQVFDLLIKSIGAPRLSKETTYSLTSLMRQVVTGHRLFLDAIKSQTESFLPLERLHFEHDPNSLELWVSAYAKTGTVAKTRLGLRALTSTAGVREVLRFVTNSSDGDSHRIESVLPISYTAGWLANSLEPLVKPLRQCLWQTVITVPPYRKYYLYASPTTEAPSRLPQLASAYAVLFYLGSITRYRPHHFDYIVSGAFGAFTENLLHELPAQLLYLYASEFVRRDVAKAAIVT